MKELRKTLREESKKSAAQFAQMKSREASTTNFTPQVNESENANNNNNNNSNDDDENKNVNNSNNSEEEMKQEQMEDLCLQCLVNKREKFALPCGHSLCSPCSEKVTVCSVCLQKVTSSITVYD